MNAQQPYFVRTIVPASELRCAEDAFTGVLKRKVQSSFGIDYVVIFHGPA